MEFWESLDVARGWVSLDRAKVTGDLNLALWTQVFEVLVPEDHDFALGNEQRELIKPFDIQLRYLDAMDLGTNVGAQDFGCGVFQKIWLGGIGAKSRISVFEQLGRGKFLVFVVVRIVGGIRRLGL